MEAQQMATTKLSNEEFWAFLEKHPDLRDRFASIVSAVENSEGNLKEADAPQFPNKFPPALMRDRFCGVRRLRLSQVRVAGHLRTLLVAHGEARWNRILPERVAPP